MPFFVLRGGILARMAGGIRDGLVSPVISYLISGMPMADILPFIDVPALVYGMAAGMMKEKYKIGLLSHGRDNSRIARDRSCCFSFFENEAVDSM